MRYDAHVDDDVTPEQVQTVLDAVKAREGPNFEGWSRTNRSLTRKSVWDIFENAAEWFRNAPETSMKRRFWARNIRREFGVHGEKPALSSPKKPRARRVERWP